MIEAHDGETIDAEVISDTPSAPAPAPGPEPKPVDTADQVMNRLPDDPGVEPGGDDQQSRRFKLF